MTKAKLKMAVISITTLAILLLVSLIVGLTFQFTKIAKLKSQDRILKSEIRKIQEQQEIYDNQMDFYNNKEALEDYYRELGYGKTGDQVFE